VGLLADAQLRYAGLHAAALACIAAVDAGEPDPLPYLRAKLHGHKPPGSPGHR
jgi:hypothetical protein